ncbi:MAG TPA: cupin domain-containing protein [Acidobacteriaceae bacterium]|nr:cupin domain-containing protein [Acidobacteriaceae bacterium]
MSAPARAQFYGEHLNLYFGDWHTAPSHTAYRNLVEQAIFTPGAALDPTSKGAVLRSASAFEHGVLPPHTSTSPIRLEGQQQVYFVESGSGTATSSRQTVSLARGIAVLMPANLEFTLANTGDRPLAMYIIQEPTQPGFQPNTSMLARDENTLPYATTDNSWAYMIKKIFVAADGLATLNDVSTVTLDPLTIGQPQVTASPDVEAVWTALRGTGLAFVSNILRRQTPGTAFLEVPDGKTPHSTVNPNEDAQVKFLYFAHTPSATPQPPHAK